MDWEITFVETGLTTATGAASAASRSTWTRPASPSPTATASARSTSTALLAHHEQQGTVGTLTGVHPGSRYGEMRVDGGSTVAEFNEKPTHADGWVNGGFFVFEREFVDALPRRTTRT